MGHRRRRSPQTQISRRGYIVFWFDLEMCSKVIEDGSMDRTHNIMCSYYSSIAVNFYWTIARTRPLPSQDCPLHAGILLKRL